MIATNSVSSGVSRVAKREMSNYWLKRPEHQTWPQPTHTGTQAIRIKRPRPPDPEP